MRLKINKKTMHLVFSIIGIFTITIPCSAQTGNYNQAANSIYSVNSYTNVTFTGTPFNPSNGTLSFQWIACHQAGFGASTLDVDIFLPGGYKDLGNYSSSLDCIGNSVNLFINSLVLDSAVRAGGGNVIFRFYISDGCQAGVGCSGINDPAVVSLSLSFAYSIADFTASDTTICQGGSVTYSDITPGGVTSRSWSFPGGSPSTSTLVSPTVTYTSPGYHPVTLTTVSPSGSNTTVKPNYVYIYALPSVSVSAGGPNTFCAGGSVDLTASPDTGYSFKWKKNGAFINGATTSGFTATSSGNFKVVATSTAGCTSTSNTVAVTSNANPVAIISAGGPVTFCPGGTVTLSAFAGSGLTYQWKKGNSLIAGATSISYVANANGTYSCKVTNGNGCTALSNTTKVTVNTPVATVTLSGVATFCQGGSVSLKANTGSGLTYQWLKSGATITGATDSTYTATVTGNYKVVVTNSCGSSTSPVKTITVNSLPAASISANGPITFCSGSTVTLIANTGAGLTYVWKKNTATISGATGSSYVASTSGAFTVRVTNASGCSSTSNAITVTVNATIATVTAGGPTTFCNGDSVVLSANTGTGLTYQWLKNNANIAGATGSKYAAKTAGTYKVIVTNTISGCPAISSGITATVNCKTGTDLRTFSVSCNPNPFNTDFHLDFENYSEEKIDISIFSLAGQLIEKHETFNPKDGFTAGSALSPGVYIVNVKQGKNEKTWRIIKNK